MYIVIAKRSGFIAGPTVNKFELLDEAQDFIKELVANGVRDVTLAQEIPMKLKVEVEF